MTMPCDTTSLSLTVPQRGVAGLLLRNDSMIGKDIKLIGLSGAIGAGKSAVGRHLFDSYGYKEVTFKKEFVIKILSSLGIEWGHQDYEMYINIFYDRELKDKPNELLNGKTPRQVMFSFSDWARSIDPYVFIKPVEQKIQKFIYQLEGRLVISDIKFDNEAEMIKRHGGLIWHIERKNNPFSVKTEHESEHGIDDKYIDRIIWNDGDMDQLRAEIARAIG